MSDWQVGDLAVCVDDSPCRNPAFAGQAYKIKAGTVLRVSWVGISNGGEPCLRFHEEPPLHPRAIAWHAERFCKIRPDEREACEEEFVTLLRRIKPMVTV